ncbi:MAG: hypothetical protein WAN86_07990 [Hyphomicrobiaceae bacterium]
MKRLTAPAKETSELMADARKRWQAAEIERAVKREAERRQKARAHAQQTVIQAGEVSIGAEL